MYFIIHYEDKIMSVLLELFGFYMFVSWRAKGSWKYLYTKLKLQHNDLLNIYSAEEPNKEVVSFSASMNIKFNFLLYIEQPQHKPQCFKPTCASNNFFFNSNGLNQF